MEIKIVKPKIWNFQVIKGKNAWQEVVYSARVSGVPPEIQGEKVFKMIVDNDYGSTLEHILIKFDLKMTKGNAPEFLEHRIVSHTGYSTRYVKVNKGINKKNKKYEIILPPHLLSFKKRDKLVKEFLKSVEKSIQTYENLLNNKIPKESARYALPFCQAVGIYHVTINLRSLLNLLSLRTCVRASPEMRCLASQIYFQLIKKLPIIRGFVGCRGFMRGTCPESNITGVRIGKQIWHYPVCPFKNVNSDIYIPTKKELEKGISIKKFNREKAIKVQEILFKKWASWS